MKFLKFFVYSMGIVMMFGIMMITYTIYKRNIILDREYVATSSSCNLANLKIMSPVKNATMNQSYLTVLTEDSELLIYDSCDGRLLSRVNLQVSNK